MRQFQCVPMFQCFGSASIKTSNIKPNSNSKKLLLRDCHFLRIRSMIDHFLIDATTAASCYSCQVIDESRLTLTSDHYPILLKLELESQPTQQAVTLNSNTKCIQWHKATSVTLETYSEVLTSKMEQSSLEGLNLNVNGFADRITECIHEAAYDALPLKRFNKYSKPYWTRDVKLSKRLVGCRKTPRRTAPILC